MRTTLVALSGLLVVQIVLAIWLNLSAGGLAVQPPETPLLAFEADAVDRVTISDREDQSVTLARSEEGWRLPDLGGIPADEAKINTLLTDLSDAEQGPAIATSDSATGRFRVSEDAYERKIVLERENGDPATIYLGTSQGTNQVHVRRADEDGVHRIAFSTWRAPTDQSDWLDMTVLQIDPQQITSLEWNGIKLEKASSEDEGSNSKSENGSENAADTTTWHATGTPVTEPPREAVNALTDQHARIRITRLVPDESSTEYQTTALALDITLQSGDTRTYTMLRGNDENSYAVRSSAHPQMMTVSGAAAEAIIDAATDPALTGVKAPPDAEATDGSSDETSKRNAAVEDAESAKSPQNTQGQ